MRSLLDLLLRPCRHALIGLAILALLVSTFGIHAHADHPGDDGHGIGLSLGWLADSVETEDDEGEPHPADPDGCGQCHCVTPPAMVAEGTTLALVPVVSALVRDDGADEVPDERAYPPDPPPVRLG